jgi:hypothetical protein
MPNSLREVSLADLANRHPEIANVLDDLEVDEFVEIRFVPADRLQNCFDSALITTVLGVVLFVACSWLPHLLPNWFPSGGLSAAPLAVIEQVQTEIVPEPEIELPILGP